MRYQNKMIVALLTLGLCQSCVFANSVPILKTTLPTVPKAVNVDGEFVAVQAPQLSESEKSGLDNKTVMASVRQHQTAIAHVGQLPAPFHFPVTTTLTPGKVNTQLIKTVLPPTAFFVIGNDKRSISWLKTHLSQLQKVHAVGYVTRVDSKTDFETLRKQAKGLSLIPVAVDSLVRQWGITHYPFWYHGGIVRQSGS